MFTANDLILFTLQDDKRVIINANSIDAVEEVDKGLTRIITKKVTIEVAMTFDQAAEVLRQVSQQNLSQGSATLYDRLMAQKSKMATNPNMAQPTPKP